MLVDKYIIFSHLPEGAKKATFEYFGKRTAGNYEAILGNDFLLVICSPP